MAEEMNVVQRFLLYAADFEKTLADDDWSRLEPHWSEDAVYRVESSLFGCDLQGRDAIFAGMKRSLDGFDRNFPEREIETSGAPEVDGDEMQVSWKVTYHKEDHPDFVLPGKSMARVADGKLVLLVDSYDPSVNDDLAKWVEQTGLKIDPSYT